MKKIIFLLPITLFLFLALPFKSLADVIDVSPLDIYSITRGRMTTMSLIGIIILVAALIVGTVFLIRRLKK